jgi:photosystem II stability/assembly factor-like uncharacterized protein
MEFHGKKTSAVMAIFLLLSVLAAVEFPFAQEEKTEENPTFRWRNIGPANMSGRISDIEALDADFTHVIVGSASGGVWKSTNAGTTWTPIFDTYGAASIGDVALCQSDPDIIWVGTGEKNPRNSIAWGDGIYKSTDGGKTFKRMGLETSHSIAKVIIHPDNPEVVFAAAAGHLWGYTGERGLFKTTDGGRTWAKLTNGLPDDGKTGAIELIMHPDNPDILWVGFWQRIRRPYRFDSGGPNGGIFKTTDGGESWIKLTEGLPEGDTGKIGLAVCLSKPDVLMAFVEHGFHPRERTPEGEENPEYADMTKLGSGIYRSEDGGESWTYVNRYNNRPFYYSHIYLNPIDDQVVYVVTGSFLISKDGGQTLERQNTGIHGDYHALWSDPAHRNRFYIGNDGGTALTHDHGRNYIFFDNIPVSQFYAIGADNRDPYFVYGGLQDNGTWGGPSNSRDSMGILTDHWFKIGGGDGFYAPVDPFDWRLVYVESQQGNVSLMNIETRESRPIRPRRESILNYDEYVTDEILTQQEEAGWGKDNPFRFNWNSPILPSKHHPGTVYFGGNFVFKSANRGETWTIISPDLSTADPEKIDRETGGLTPDVTGAENHCTVVTLAESPIDPALLWAGTDDGNVHITRNGGKNWANVRKNFKGVPGGIWVSRVEASHFAEGTCYVTFDGHRSDNFQPWVFKTTDFGKTWTDISANIPDGQVAYVIREDFVNRRLLFLGTEFGLFLSLDGGSSWEPMMNGLPISAVHDILIHPQAKDLIAGTHGRGIWICDDISPLQQMTEMGPETKAHLFTPRTATQWHTISRGGNRGQFLYQGENPPQGALLHTYLSQEVKEAVLEITDWEGEKTVSIKLEGKAGIQRSVWDFRFNPPDLNDQEKELLDQYVKATEWQARREIQEKLSNSLEARGESFAGISRRENTLNPIPAPPGHYKVTLKWGKGRTTRPLTVRKDPILK